MPSTDPAQDRVAAICAKLLPAFNFELMNPVAAGHSLYRIESADGERLALKLFFDTVERGSGPEALASESAALTELYRLGCPVPRLVAADGDLGALATEWIEGRTLEAHLQQGPLAAAEREGVLRSLAAMETAYRAITARHEPAAAAQRELIARTREELAEIASSPPVAVAPANHARWAQELDRAADAVTTGPWSYGSLDCSSSNLLLADDHAYVIDLSILGAEWRERRSVRYAVATGSARPEGRYAGLFDAEAAAQYATLITGDESPEAVAQLLDLHHLLVLLAALARHNRSPANPSDPQRRRSLLELARRPLAPGGIAGALRALLPKHALE